MNSSNNNIIDGDIYPFYSVNLAFTSFYKNNGDSDTSISLKFIPTKIDEQEGVKQEYLYSENFLIGSLLDASVEEKLVIDQLYSAIQNYINLKGL